MAVAAIWGCSSNDTERPARTSTDSAQGTRDGGGAAATSEPRGEDAGGTEGAAEDAALVAAIDRADPDAAQALLADGADPNAQDALGNHVLALAFNSGQTEVCRALLRHGADPTAARLTTTEVLTITATDAELIQAVESGQIAARDYAVALEAAAMTGRADVVRALLGRGADPSVPQPEGWTALHSAAIAGQAETLGLLLDSDAFRWEAIGNGSMGLLEAAVRGGNPRCLKLLLEAPNAEPEAPPLTVHHLTLAAAEGNPTLVRMIAGHGVDVNASNDVGATPLDMAVMGCHREVVATLLELGADPNTPGPTSGSVILHTATRQEDTAVVQALLDGGASPDRQDIAGRTALHIAAKQGARQIVERLLAAGADPEARDIEGRTPADTAAAAGHSNVAEILSRASGS
jgi:ankyrin repeat protein